MTQSYPLQWPEGVDRTPTNRRQRTPFRTGFDSAVSNVAKSLTAFARDTGVKIENVVLSTNCDLINRKPADPGACAWFQFEGVWTAFPVDRFSVPEANIQAIHHIVEARRTEMRYGGINFIRQAFKSFQALPAPGHAESALWWNVLGVSQSATAADIEAAYRSKAKTAHPDSGGEHAAMAELNAARSAARRALGI